MKPPSALERDVLKACLEYLQHHRAVAFAYRQNSGAVKANYRDKSRYVRFNTMPGVSDIIGMLKNGKFLAIECKRVGNKPTIEQASFLEMVRRNNGVAIVAYSVDDVAEALIPF